MKQGKFILQTNRLLLREMTPADMPALCKILQDEKVMYAYAHPFTQEECDQWMEKQLQRYRQDGFGLWAVILKDTGEMIGQCGLTWQDLSDKQVVEIGYLFQRAYWHHGYAIESAKACKEYAFHTLHSKVVYSIIRDNNLSSQKVAIKNGMTQRGLLQKHYYGLDMPHLIFAVTAKDKAGGHTNVL